MGFTVRGSVLLALSTFHIHCGPVEVGPPDESQASSLGSQPQAVGACSTNALLNGVRTWVHFANPDAPCVTSATGFVSNSGRDLNVLVELKRLIDHTPRGGVIKGHIFAIDVDSLGQALLNAQARGVAVYISTDPAVGASTDPSKTSYLDKLTHKVYCSPANGLPCIGTSTNSAAASHVKAFTFKQGTSTTGIPSPSGATYDYVTWVSSANMTYVSGTDMYQNSVSIYGWDALNANMDRYLDDLYNQVQYSQYYEPASGRGYWSNAPGQFYASPSPNTDLVVDRLDEITPDTHCKVRVMQSFINDSRPAVTDKLVQMKNAGCTVYVVANSIEATSLSKLKGAGIPVRKNDTHDKVFLIYGNYSGTYKYHVYTGSHNIGITANNTNDELLVKLAAEPASSDATTRPIYNAYYNHFYDAYDSGTAL
jgi:phosphatidylserine/phosphatidylglycerophosphate/cardiolipin synthase-like enzyme